MIDFHNFLFSAITYCAFPPELHPRCRSFSHQTLCGLFRLCKPGLGATSIPFRFARIVNYDVSETAALLEPRRSSRTQTTWHLLTELSVNLSSVE